jgi:RNA 2',3'-cyclic 3'-phosphodiesterase
MRLFIGIPLPGEYARIIGEIQDRWKKRLSSNVTWVRPELVHVTLKFLGEVDQGRVADIVSAMGALARESFGARGGVGGVFPDRGAPRVVWVGMDRGGEECAECFRCLDDGLARTGFAPESRPFRPHLTVARIKVADRGDDWPGLLRDLGQGWPEFAVDRIVLWQSVLSSFGPTYRKVAEMRLTVRDQLRS